MFGRTRDQPGLLVEPHPTHAINVKSEAEVAQFRNLIWYLIIDLFPVSKKTNGVFIGLLSKMPIKWHRRLANSSKR